nr:ubiquitin hydrolase [Tanacetum cinerariifolium]
PQQDSTTASTSEGSVKKKGRTVAFTTDDMQKRRNDTFSGNKATKKTMKNLLKQQYGNFKAEAKNSSGNKEVNTASIPTASTQDSPAGPNVTTASISLDTASSKDLDNLLGCQRSNKNKEGLGYSAIPPPHAQVYYPPKKDMSWTGLSEFVDDTITDYSRPSPSIENNSDDFQNKKPFVAETGASSSTILSKPAIKFVKATERPTEIKTNKVETVKKLAVKYAELYKKTSNSPNVRGNQRNWNNLKSHQLGKNFEMKNKACFNCGDFN